MLVPTEPKKLISTENWPVVVILQLLPTPYYSGQSTSELLFYYFIGRNTLMRWQGILFWNFSVFQVSKSIKSGAWWPIVWGFYENYFSQKVHCDIRDSFQNPLFNYLTRAEKFKVTKNKVSFENIYLLIFIFWPKNVLSNPDTHDTYWVRILYGKYINNTMETIKHF